jgi:hypothetical protein
VFELIAARQCENCIDSVVRESACRLSYILVPRVDCQIGDHLAHELQAVDAGRGREHASATKFGELDGKRSNTA